MKVYQHGPQSCRTCFLGNEEERVHGNWKLTNNPVYYGSSNPEVLVLGFSKGATQNTAVSRTKFDQIAFAGMRPRLQQILEVLGLIPPDGEIYDIISAKESEYGFASLVRCSLSMRHKGKWVTSRSVMPQALKEPESRKIMKRCAARHLTSLPSRVRLVVLLKNSTGDVDSVMNLMQDLFPDYQSNNPMAFSAARRTWIFTTHPSPANGYFKSWFNGNSSTSASQKRQLALETFSGKSSELDMHHD